MKPCKIIEIIEIKIKILNVCQSSKIEMEILKVLKKKKRINELT
jgi:hypothetical protein